MVAPGAPAGIQALYLFLHRVDTEAGACLDSTQRRPSPQRALPPAPREQGQPGAPGARPVRAQSANPRNQTTGQAGSRGAGGPCPHLLSQSTGGREPTWPCLGHRPGWEPRWPCLGHRLGVGGRLTDSPASALRTQTRELEVTLLFHEPRKRARLCPQDLGGRALGAPIPSSLRLRSSTRGPLLPAPLRGASALAFNLMASSSKYPLNTRRPLTLRYEVPVAVWTPHLPAISLS